MYDYLTEENWKELYRKYPGLEGSMATLSNANELTFLKHELAHDNLYPGRKAWVIKRIEELEQVVKPVEPKSYDDLFKLAGMVHAQGSYTPEEWVKKTGIDPRGWPGFISITSNGKCIWTLKAEELYQKYCKQRDDNWKALGV